MKPQIKRNLNLAKEQLDAAILEFELRFNWQNTHKFLVRAIQELEDTKSLIARYHLKNCVKTITQENIEEIVKTYKYLN